jgi:hypothetical protein
MDELRCYVTFDRYLGKIEERKRTKTKEFKALVDKNWVPDITVEDYILTDASIHAMYKHLDYCAGKLKRWENMSTTEAWVTTPGN